ncbi:hypothetical protein DNTS_031149 [Danionella cerebrum]|uniref:Major facilitator superfamily (MFS) profile domain-containing protein n=1 Tax=Danionella cerebrum TaxID=2873325 RepID=A0A553MLP1_9TELE|nr:hypothetical protein DNTS_031149 [Danionella translucida]
MGTYDQDTAFLGQKGPFFILLFLFLNSIYISTGLHGLYFVFVGASPSHQCYVPDLNLTEEWRKASVPVELVNGESRLSRCRRYSAEIVRNMSGYSHTPEEVDLTHIPQEGCVDGWRFSTEVYHSTIVSEWDLVCDREWIVPFTSSTLYMGYLLGSLGSGQLSDRFGRKKVLFFSLTAESLLMLLQSFSPSWTTFSFLYFFIGAFQISIYITAFVLGSEVLSRSLRVVFCTLGAFLHYCIGYMILPWMAFIIRDWRTLLRVNASMTAIYIPLFWLIPESPRWLLSQGRTSEAEAIVKEDSPEKKKFSALDVLRSGEIRRTTFLCLLLWMAINIGYFGLSLNTSHLSGDPFLNCFLSAVSELPAYLVSTGLLRCFPRRAVLSSFLVSGGAFLLLIQIIPPALEPLALALEMAGKFGFTMSFSVVYIYTTELYPTVLRNLGMGICSSAARLGSITAPYIIYLGTFNRFLPYILMGSLTILSSVSNLFLPETFREDLPETLEQMQNSKSLCWRSRVTRAGEGKVVAAEREEKL